MYNEFGDAQQRRVYRGTHHVFYLNGIRVEPQSLDFEVFSAGSGKQYDVQIHADRGVSCSCPDHSRNGTPLCKHIVFVLSRRLASPSLPIPPPGAGFGHKIRFSQGEYDAFRQTAAALLVERPPQLRDESKFTHEESAAGPSKAPKGVRYAERKRAYTSEETCCFCLDELELTTLQKDPLSHQWCPTCENLWHPDCFQTMKQYQERQRPPRAAACPFCRTVITVVCAPFPEP